jgi:hypothetical protein
MAVDRGVKSHQRRLLEGELDLVGLVVPQVVNSETLLVVEVLLGLVVAMQVPGSVQGLWQLFVVAPQGLVEGFLVCLPTLLAAYEELVVSTPTARDIVIWSSLLEKPNSEIGPGLKNKDSQHLVVCFLSSDEADSGTSRTLSSFNLLPSSFIKCSF